MNPIPDDELLSAYLDGELPADERLRVERWLAGQPDSRQLLDELRALRGTLEAAPRYRLEDDFAERVLRAAERTMLAGDTPAVKDGAAVKDGGDGTLTNGRSRAAARPVPASLADAAWSNDATGPSRAGWSIRAGWSWQRARRPMICAGAALAAGLLIMIAQRLDGPRHAPVAVARNRPNGDIGAVPGARGPGVRGPLPESSSFRPLSPASPADAAHAANEPAAAGKLGAVGAPHAGAVAGQPPAPAGAALETPGASRGGKPVESLLEPKQAESKAVLRDRPGGLGEAGERLAEDLEQDKTLLVVECQVAADLLDRPEFQQFFAKHNIILEQAPVELSTLKLSMLKKATNLSQFADRTDTADGTDTGATATPDERDGDEKGGDGKGAEEEGAEEEGPVAFALDALAAGEADGLLVEASETQLDAVLADLRRHPELFERVEVRPAPILPARQAVDEEEKRVVEASTDTPPPPAAVPAPPEARPDAEDRPVDARETPSEPANDAASAAAPQGRAVRLESVRLEPRPSEAGRPEARKSAAFKEANDPVVKRRKTAKNGEESPSTAATPGGGAARPKAAAGGDKGRKLKPAEATDTKPTEVLQKKKAPSVEDSPSEEERTDEARRAKREASTPRRALLIFRRVQLTD